MGLGPVIGDVVLRAYLRRGLARLRGLPPPAPCSRASCRRPAGPRARAPRRCSLARPSSPDWSSPSRCSASPPSSASPRCTPRSSACTAPAPSCSSCRPCSSRDAHTRPQGPGSARSTAVGDRGHALRGAGPTFPALFADPAALYVGAAFFGAGHALLYPAVFMLAVGGTGAGAQRRAREPQGQRGDRIRGRRPGARRGRGADELQRRLRGRRSGDARRPAAPTSRPGAPPASPSSRSLRRPRRAERHSAGTGGSRRRATRMPAPMRIPPATWIAASDSDNSTTAKRAARNGWMFVARVARAGPIRSRQ